MANYCPICKTKLGISNKTKVADGLTCGYCASIMSSFQTASIKQIQDCWEENSRRFKNFTETSRLSNMGSKIVVIDDNYRQFYITQAKLKVTPIIYMYSEVEGFYFEAVGEKNVTVKKGGVGRAVVGGALFGGVGALVGATTAKQETKTVGGIRVMKLQINAFYGRKTVIISSPPVGFSEFLNNCTAIKSNVAQPSNFSTADELLKFKALLDQGAITQEEFDEQKIALLKK